MADTTHCCDAEEEEELVYAWGSVPHLTRNAGGHHHHRPEEGSKQKTRDRNRQKVPVTESYPHSSQRGRKATPRFMSTVKYKEIIKD